MVSLIMRCYRWLQTIDTRAWACVNQSMLFNHTSHIIDPYHIFVLYPQWHGWVTDNTLHTILHVYIVYVTGNCSWAFYYPTLITISHDSTYSRGIAIYLLYRICGYEYNRCISFSIYYHIHLQFVILSKEVCLLLSFGGLLL